ncbi:protein kinase [bacterium]|nr:protein kinase [bacterium]
MFLTAGTKLGPYIILAPLGAGGMGEVYRARDSRLDRDVAIKVLPDHLAKDSTALKRFEREAKAIATLSHPNILTIHDVGIDQQISYLVAELLEGETLRVRLARTSFSSKEVLDIAVGIAEGLAAAHTKGVIHRDLKPENIFLMTDGRVKILDFGLARGNPILTQEELTQAATASVETEVGIIRGTVPYMSPEQVRGSAVDTRTDIFSFGCVLYEMLSGRRAFAGETPADTMSAILSKDPPAIADVSAPLLLLIQRCLEKNPERRFHSAHDVAISLKDLDGTTQQSTGVTGTSSKLFWLWGTFAVVIVIALVAVFQLRGPADINLKRIESIAVLPLDNLSGDPQQEYFADGMTEAFINELGQLSGLRVISRTSVMQYKNTKTSLSKIAHDLKVDAVLEGSVLQVGNHVEISARLLDPKTENRLWSKTYERDLRDIQSLRKEISRAIVQEIHLTITPEEKSRLNAASTIDPEAYRLYLRGNFHMNKLTEDAFRKALSDYQKAIEIDPNYAPAYAGIAMAYIQLGSWFSTLPREEVYSKAKAAVLKALELDEQLAEAHLALGTLKNLHEWDWAGADAAFRRGLELNPRSANGLVEYANYLTAMGRFQESILIAKRAVDIDPLSPVTYNELSFSYWYAGNKEASNEQIRRSLELAPDFHQTILGLAYYYAFEGNYEASIGEYHKLMGKSLEQIPSELAAYIGWIYGLAGKREEATRLLDELSRRPETEKAGANRLALIHIGLGNKDRAVEMLEKAYENHETTLVWLKVLEFYDPLRDHPRFQALVQRMNLPNH